MQNIKKSVAQAAKLVQKQAQNNMQNKTHVAELAQPS